MVASGAYLNIDVFPLGSYGKIWKQGKHKAGGVIDQC